MFLRLNNINFMAGRTSVRSLALLMDISTFVHINFISLSPVKVSRGPLDAHYRFKFDNRDFIQSKMPFTEHRDFLPNCFVSKINK
jgi:hypothetical protein